LFGGRGWIRNHRTFVAVATKSVKVFLNGFDSRYFAVEVLAQIQFGACVSEWVTQEKGRKNGKLAFGLLKRPRAQNKRSIPDGMLLLLVGEGGFEPPKSETTDLQSAQKWLYTVAEGHRA